MRIRLSRFLLWFAALCLLGPAAPLMAHGYLVRQIPADRAVLAYPPSRLQYWFSEGLEPRFSLLRLRDAAGNILAEGGVDPDNPLLMTLRVPPNLPDGAYIVELRPAFATDGHVVAESRVFFVGQTTQDLQATAASDTAEPLEVVWRALLSAATSVLLGAFVVYNGVLVKAWGNPAHHAGLLPPRVMTRLYALVTIGLVVAMAAHLLALLQQTMVFFNVDAITALTGGLWQVVRVGSRFGDMWHVRLAFFLLAVALHAVSWAYRQRSPQIVRPIWAAQQWVMVAIIASFAVTNHAAGALVWPWVALAANALHLLGVAFWVGGLVALVWVFPVAVAPYSGAARQEIVLAAMRRFSRYLLGAVALVITTGIYSALSFIFSPAEAQTRYGSALGFKLLLVALLLCFGAAHHLALRPNLAVRLERLFTAPLPARWRLTLNSGFYRLIALSGRFGLSLRLEALVAILILASAAWLSATPTPQPAFLDATPPAPNARQESGDWVVDMTISPGGPGINSYDLLISQNGRSRDDLTVAVQTVQPTRDWRSAWIPADPADDALYIATSDAINRSGRWWTIVSITDPQGASAHLAYEWDISDSASVTTSIPPSPWNLLAFVGCLAAIAYLLYPAARRLYLRLDLRPTTLVAAGGLIAMSVIVIVGGIILVNDNLARYEATLNPPPSIVNDVLPSQASLDRGRALWSDACPWADQDDYIALLARVSVERDDWLYRALEDGWRDLPPCDPMTTADRWDVVNYLRYGAP